MKTNKTKTLATLITQDTGGRQTTQITQHKQIYNMDLNKTGVNPKAHEGQAVPTSYYTFLSSSQSITSIYWPCNCTVRVFVLIQISDCVWSYWSNTQHLFRISRGCVPHDWRAWIMSLFFQVQNNLERLLMSKRLISMCLLLSLGRYLCWWTIIPWGYHPPSSQCFGTDMVY